MSWNTIFTVLDRAAREIETRLKRQEHAAARYLLELMDDPYDNTFLVELQAAIAERLERGEW